MLTTLDFTSQKDAKYSRGFVSQLQSGLVDQQAEQGIDNHFRGVNADIFRMWEPLDVDFLYQVHLPIKWTLYGVGQRASTNS